LKETISGNEIIYKTSLLIPHQQSASFSLGKEGANIRVVVKFRDLPESKDESGLQIEGDGNTANLTFDNWNNQLGTALTTPAKMADLSNGNSLTFLATHWKIGNLDKVDFQFMQEPKKND
jgi:hypothetical protein